MHTQPSQIGIAAARPRALPPVSPDGGPCGMAWPAFAVAAAVLAGLVLGGCGGDGAGGYTPLAGTWQGTWQEGAVPGGAQASPATAPALEPQDHSTTGSIRVTFAVSAAGTVTGTATMNPDVCAAGEAEVAMQIDVEVTGTLTGDQLSFSYVSPLVADNGTATWTSDSTSDPMQGTYDGSACEPPKSNPWIGGFSLSKES